nr:tRNA (adenosine(37)-N6)-threonylcarbamoyltransferase complex ATPase subunit type 1 TsaE [Gottschalkia acidurici]
MLKISTKSPEETEEIGYNIGKSLSGGEIICMVGDLGAGKTTMTKSLARGLEIEDYITSPTFTIVNEYEGRLKLYHFDVYRIGDVEEMYDLGYEEYFYSDGVCIIEWSNLIEDILPKERITIEIKRGIDDNTRDIIIDGTGQKYEDLIKELNY